jgi:hypothetical protein
MGREIASDRKHRAEKHSDAEWDRRFAKFVDPDYYSDERSFHPQSTLNGGTYPMTENKQRKKTKIAEA